MKSFAVPLLKVLSGFFGICALVSCGPSKPQKDVPETIVLLFGIHLQDDFQVIEREFEHTHSIQGVVYWESASLGLSARDYTDLTRSLSANPRFKKRTHDGHEVFDDDSNNSRRVSWSAFPDRLTFSYHYSEQ